MGKLLKMMDEHPRITVFLSGLVMSLCFVYKYLFWLAWVGAVPFGYILFNSDKISVGRAFRTVFLFGLGFYGLQYTWFLSLHSLEYMKISELTSMAVVVLIWLAVTLAQTLQMSVAGLAFGLIKPKGVWAPLILALLMMIIEWAQGFGDFAMVWGKIALSQYAFLPNLQIVSLFGSLFLGFVILSVNGLLALALVRLRLGGVIRAVALGALALFVGNMFVGTAIWAVKDNMRGESVKVASIQCNFPSDEKWDTSDSEIWEELIQLTSSAIDGGAQVIVWPESALKTNMMVGEQYYEQLKVLAKDADVYFFVGGFTEMKAEDGEWLDYNSFVGIYPSDNSGTNEIYNKRQLVPFGEFVPIAGLLERFEALSALNLKSSQTPGDKAVVFDTPYAKFSPLICFDSIFPHYARQAVRKGADILMVGTNDSWFLGSEAVYQHNGHAVLRATENNKWLVRSANAGQSSIIRHDGKVVKALVPATSGVVMDDVQIITQDSLYSVIGDLPFLIAAFGFAGYAFVKFRLGYTVTDLIRFIKDSKNPKMDS